MKEPGGNPYPGLRPFRTDEEHLFFGREGQLDFMIERLARTHFLAVIGSSGSGNRPWSTAACDRRCIAG